MKFLQTTQVLLLSCFFGSALAITCSPVHIINARGSGISTTNDGLKNVANKITAQLEGYATADQAELDYPASGDFSVYKQSITSGQEALHSAIQSYVKSCPTSKIVLMGFSQVYHPSTKLDDGGAKVDIGC